jgi:hypothetical protein
VFSHFLFQIDARKRLRGSPTRWVFRQNTSFSIKITIHVFIMHTIPVKVNTVCCLTQAVATRRNDAQQIIWGTVHSLLLQYDLTHGDALVARAWSSSLQKWTNHGLKKENQFR